MYTRTILFVFLLVMAGCSGQQAANPTETEDFATDTPSIESTSTISTATDTPETTLTPTATRSPTPTMTPAPDNPWRSEAVVIGVSNYSTTGVQYDRAITNTISYWNQSGMEYSEYNVSFHYRPNATDPDVRIRFVDEITDCGVHANVTNIVGCAPINDGRVVTTPQEIQIVTGYTNESTEQTIKHEIGHVLGLEHGQRPMPLMSARSETTLQSSLNATERAFAFQSKSISYYIDAERAEPMNGQRLAERELSKTIRYYESGADGTIPANVTFHQVDSESKADIVFRFGEDDICSSAGVDQSCGRWYGLDEDTDPALEYHTNATIALVSLPQDVWSWHAGYWLGYAFGAPSEQDLPKWFRDTDADEREDWYFRACPNDCSSG